MQMEDFLSSILEKNGLKLRSQQLLAEGSYAKVYLAERQDPEELLQDPEELLQDPKELLVVKCFYFGEECQDIGSLQAAKELVQDIQTYQTDLRVIGVQVPPPPLLIP